MSPGGISVPAILNNAKNRIEQLGLGGIAGGAGVLAALGASSKLHRLMNKFPSASGDIAYLVALTVVGGALGGVAMSQYRAMRNAPVPLSSWEELLEAKERWLQARQKLLEDLQGVNPDTRDAIIKWIDQGSHISM